MLYIPIILFQTQNYFLKKLIEMVQTTIDLRNNLKGPKTGRPKNISTQPAPTTTTTAAEIVIEDDKNPEFTAMGKGVFEEEGSGTDSSFMSENDELNSCLSEKPKEQSTTVLSEKSKRIKKMPTLKKRQKQVEYVSYPALRPNSENLVKNYIVSLKYRDESGKMKTSSVCFGNNNKKRKRTVGEDETIPSDEDISKDKFWLKHWLNKPNEERLGAYGAIRDKVGLA